MDNSEFLSVIGKAFKKFLETGSRSNEKLKILHGAIAEDIGFRLGESFEVSALGIGEGKEKIIEGRYMEKMVDVTIERHGRAVAGVAVKFVMQNYAQNSNNYFENMLGETANIRCANIPYFQIFIIPDKLPYYKNNGVFQKWEEIKKHHVEKYRCLSQDNVELLLHASVKTLLSVVHLPEPKHAIETRKDYVKEYGGMDAGSVRFSDVRYGTFGGSVIYNDWETFAQKVAWYIRSL